MEPTIEKIENFINSNDKFIITTHESPDADGLGAEIAFLELLNHFNKKAIIYNGDPTPFKYLFMDIDKEINLITEEFVFPEDIEEYSLFVLDTNDFSNTGNVYKRLKDTITNIFVIDHHEGSDHYESNYIKVHASSASEIICDIFAHFSLKPTFKSAQALYTGILFDTGSFRYPKTSPKTFNIISGLVELGANPTKLYEKIYENNDIRQFLLQSKILSTIEVYHDHQMIVMHLTPEMLIETGASFSDGEICINIPLTIKGVVASVLLKQDIEGPLKVSMRTKGEMDVAEIAINRNGGGHKNAAGYKSILSREKTLEQVLSDMEKFF